MATTTEQGTASGPHPSGGPRANRRPTAVALAVIGGLVVGGVIGGVAGWKIEQQRVKDDVEGTRPIGTVLELSENSVTIELSGSDANRTFRLTPETIVANVSEDGEPRDVALGDEVLVVRRGGTVAELLVFPDGSIFDG